MRLPEFAVDKRVSTFMLGMIVVVAGLISLTGLGLDMLPDIDIPIVTVVTAYEGASPEEVESALTKPIEQMVASVSGVEEVTSNSMEGTSVVMVQFGSGTNLDFAAQDLRDQLANLEDFLPSGVRRPLVMKFDLSQIPIIFYGITSQKRSSLALAKYIDENISHRLERLEGVAAVIVQSPERPEISVAVNRDALEATGITLNQIIQILRTENLNLPAGRINRDHKEFLIRTKAEFRSLDEVRNLVVGISRTGKPITLRQIAKITDTIKETRLTARIQGSEGVVMMISKQSGANVVNTAKKVKAEIARIEEQLPPDIKFHVGMDQSIAIERMVSSTGQAAILGGVFAMALIYFFLGSIRPTLTIGIAIPVSMIATFIPLRLAGYTLNLLTLGGLALGVGMLVDNAIVVIESMFRHLEEGATRRDAAKKGASEVGLAITASTFTTLAVFFPMAIGSGMAGQLARGLALSISFAILASLFVSLTIVPMVGSIFFKKHKRAGEYSGEISAGRFGKMRLKYSKVLEKALRMPKKVLGGAMAAFVLSIFLMRFVGTEFMPSMDQAMLMLKVVLPTGTELAETDRVVRKVEEELLSKSGVITVIAFSGANTEDRQQSAGGFGAAGSHEGILMTRLSDRSSREKSTSDMMEELRQTLPAMKDVKVEEINIGDMGGNSAPVIIKILGRDFAVLKSVSDEIQLAIADVEGLRDIKSTMEDSRPEYHIRLNREEINRMGLSSGQIASTIKTSTLGQVATRFRLAGEETDVRVKFQSEDRKTLRDIQMINFTTPMGTKVPLMQISTIEEAEGPMTILHENQVRGVLVTANIAGRDLGSVIADIQERLEPLLVRLPEGYFIEFGGAFEDMVETFITLGQALALAILLVYMVMASQFESFVHPFVIMFTIPLALIGVVIAFLVTGQTISMPSFIGFIMLTGIVVNNGIVMVDAINQLRKKGMALMDATIQAASTRLRPVLITALTTIFGMLPMALSSQEGAEMRAPLAITVIGGLIAATPLTLFVVPAVYLLVSRDKVVEQPAG